MYSNHNVDETATMPKFRNTVCPLLYWQMTSIPLIISALITEESFRTYIPGPLS